MFTQTFRISYVAAISVCTLCSAIGFFSGKKAMQRSSEETISEIRRYYASRSEQKAKATTEVHNIGKTKTSGYHVVLGDDYEDTVDDPEEEQISEDLSDLPSEDEEGDEGTSEEVHESSGDHDEKRHDAVCEISESMFGSDAFGFKTLETYYDARTDTISTIGEDGREIPIFVPSGVISTVKDKLDADPTLGMLYLRDFEHAKDYSVIIERREELARQFGKKIMTDIQFEEDL